MDALQVVSAATQIVSSMVGAVSALEQASRNIDEAPNKIRCLEEFVSDLEKLSLRIKQKHVSKLHNSHLELKIQSLNRLIERLHPNISKARKIVSKSRAKNFAKVVWSAVTGDPLSKLVQSMRNDLNWWLEAQKLSKDVENVIEHTAKSLPTLLRVNAEKGYPTSNKCHYLKSLLEQDEVHRVILIVGLSGIGKSCLARQVASDPPRRFVHGAVELGFGQWCSRAACNGNKSEYHKRLVKKFYRFLVQIGFRKQTGEDAGMDLEDACSLLQEALIGKSILVVLDDVWEQDIVEKFAKLYDNDCKYLVTTRNEAVYEITEAEKVEICKEDIREISKAILLYHSLLGHVELPSVADTLLEGCGHHPLTVAVMGKALRKEMSSDKWIKAISNLTTYATCAPGPISYVNEKETETALTVFGSFEFSLEAMPEDSRRLFVVLAAISWVEAVPEACLEALWGVLGQEDMFPLVVCKLVEGSLLIKTESYPMYHVHDMVSLYLTTKVNDAVNNLLVEVAAECAASVAPWLFVFGKDTIKTIAEQKMGSFLDELEEKNVGITLEAIVSALMASKSISELEASSVNFRNILGPRIVALISTGTPDTIASAAKAISNIFNKNDFYEYVRPLENMGGIDKLIALLEVSEDPLVETNVSAVLARLSECGSPETMEKILMSMPMNRLADLLVPDSEEWHESVFAILMSLTKAGKSKAVEKMFCSGIDKKLIRLLEVGSDMSQHHAMVMLKTFYEMGGSLADGHLRAGTLSFLPWHARFTLERFVLPERDITLSPKLQSFEDLVPKILARDSKRVLEAMQELIPIIENAGQPTIRDRILQSPLVERLTLLLQYTSQEQNQVRSQASFVLMKLACSGGEPCIRKFLDYDIVHELVMMMQCNIPELQESAYTTIHEMLFTQGGSLVSGRIFRDGLIERLVHSLDSKTVKTRELCAHCLLDLVQVGNKQSMERIFSLQVVEKFVTLEKAGSNFKGIVVSFVKGMDKCKHLSTTERRVMKQQVLRKVRTAVKGYKLERHLVVEVEACIAEGSGSRGASTSKQRK
ncbi:hypothetical protein H6P81_004185 [Aristolochia fimbriata]|uniref:NB-ARC domain-containing protein n=1 Tax=Aristolochia fimbriata TaxID=158543 RepID=A0AAV7FHU2_ARIFI|nr:hypothetical protein H6P81_004185 [Aristolochia fimbriata]